MPRQKGAERVWAWLYPEELRTLDDLAKVAGLPDNRAQQVRFAIRLLRWTYGSQIGALLDDIKGLLTSILEILHENDRRL